MQTLNIALVQLDVTVGALADNADKMVAAAQAAAANGAHVVVFPELALSGYPPEDLVLQPHFLRDVQRQLDLMAGRLPPQAMVLVGAPDGASVPAGNAAVVFSQGARVAAYRKHMLPNYGVFDEKRLFAMGHTPLVLEVHGFRIAVHICEDSWYLDQPPITQLPARPLDGLINLSASPYHRGKLSQREEILRRLALRLATPVLYCNLVGGQDELVFDGASMVIGADGRLLARAPQFREETLHFALPRRDTPTPANPAVVAAMDPVAEVYAALILGLRDYVEKNRFKKVVVALSGGIDSALVATLAVDALGAGRVAGVTMPSTFTSADTLGDAGLLARTLGIEFFTVPIAPVMQAYEASLRPLWPDRPADVTEENLQARIRGANIMAISNKFGWLVLTTGNKSEMATGYCTLYGDMAGGFAVIKDVPKTLVYELSAWRNRQAPVIPQSTIDRAPTAELRPNQKDTDSLPPYDLLDQILERYVEKDQGRDEIVAAGFDPATVTRVIRMVDFNEYKRRQGPPGIKITPKAFGKDRRMPITNRYAPSA